MSDIVFEDRARWFMGAFRYLSECAHANARAKGFWDMRDNLEALAAKEGEGTAIAMRKMIDSNLRELTISELSEAMEGDRNDHLDDKIPEFTMVEAELADAIIRIMDYSAARKLRVAEALVAKMKFNQGREHMHGGKKF